MKLVSRGPAAWLALLPLILASGALALGPSPSDFDGPADPGGMVRDEERPAASSLRGLTDVRNVDTSEEFATIADALADADTQDGHVLEVQVASHAEGIVTVSKSVTIRGGGGGALVTPTTNTGSSGDARGWFLITVPNVTFQDLQFDGTGYLIYQALRYNPGSSGLVERCDFAHMAGTPSSYDGRGVATQGPVTVRECTFTDMYRIGVHIFGPGTSGTVVERCTFTGKGAGDWLDYAIELGGGAIATLTDNTITDCVGVALVDSSGSAGVLITDYFAPGTEGTLTGNFINACSAGIADGYLATDASVTVAHGNDLSGNTYGVISENTTKTLDASANWWGSGDAGAVAAAAGAGVDYTPWLNVGTDTGVAAGFQGDFSVLNVDDDSPQAGAANRIQEGMDLVSGSTVNVMAGTYEGQVAASGPGSIVLQGAGKATTFIHAPTTLVSQFTTGGTTTNRPIVAALNGATLEVRDFTIDGLGRGNGNYRFSGVAFWNAGGKVLNCDVLDIRETPFSGNQHGVGIYAYNDTGGPYSIEVGNCVFTGYQKNGLALSGTGLTVNVHDCVTTGAGDTGVIAQNGIQVSYGAGGTVANCSITDMRWTGATWVSSGLLVYQATPMTVSNVTLVDAQEAVYWADASGTINGLDVSYVSSVPDYESVLFYNSTTAMRAGGDRPLAAPMEESFGGAATLRTSMAVTLTGGCVTGTGGAASAGVYAYSESEPLVVDVTNLRVANYDYGFVAWGTPTSLDVTDCFIAGNLTAGYDNTGSLQPQDATHNWWGAASGPSGIATGAGDALLGSGVAYAAWRMDGGSSTTCAFTPVNNDFNTAAPGPAPGCISTPNPCLTVPMAIQRYDSANLRAFSVTLTLSPELVLCTSGSIVEGTYLSSIGGTVFQVVDNGGGSYTVDGSILGTPCGQTAATGTLFTVGVASAGTDGTGTITVDEVTLRDCANDPISAEPGAPLTITIDTVGPVAVDDLASVQDKSGNGLDGVTAIDLSLTPPGDAAAVRIFRKGFGGYPEYDDGTGVAPAIPTSVANAQANGWAETSVVGTGGADEPSARDFWYYVAFTEDACGNESAVSNMTGGTLNYHLGDVVPGSGDNLVTGLDVSRLGAHYGITLSDPDTYNDLDVGPTTDHSVDGRPLTDNRVNFEDMIMFAINFDEVSRALPTSPGEMFLGDPHLALSTEVSGERVFARLTLEDHGRTVQGTHASVEYDATSLELVGVTQGTLLGTQDGPVFFGTIPAEGLVEVDAARLGNRMTLRGSGEVAVLEFRRLGGTALPSLEEVALRDIHNRPATRPGEDPVLTTGEPAVASSVSITEVQLVGARPNPFGDRTEIVFRIPVSSRATVRIHDVTGRLVRTLVDGTVEPGEHRAVWDGRTDEGTLVGSGIYFTTLRAGDVVQTRKMLYAR